MSPVDDAVFGAFTCIENHVAELGSRLRAEHVIVDRIIIPADTEEPGKAITHDLSLRDRRAIRWHKARIGWLVALSMKTPIDEPSDVGFL